MHIRHVLATLLVWYVAATEAGVTRRDSIANSEDATETPKESDYFLLGHQKRQEDRQRGRGAAADGSGRRQPRPGGRLGATPNAVGATGRSRDRKPRPTAQPDPSGREDIGSDRRQGDSRQPQGGLDGGRYGGRESPAYQRVGDTERTREQHRPSAAGLDGGREDPSGQRGRQDESNRQLRAQAEPASGRRVAAGEHGGEHASPNGGARQSPVPGSRPQHIIAGPTKSHSTPTRSDKSAYKHRVSQAISKYSKAKSGGGTDPAMNGDTMEAPPWKEKEGSGKGVATHGQKQPAGTKAPPDENHGSSEGGKKAAPTGDKNQPGGSKPPDQTKKPGSTGDNKSQDGSKQPPDKTQKPSDESGKAKNQGGDDNDSSGKGSGGKAAGSVDFKNMPMSELKASYPGRYQAVKTQAFSLAGRIIPTKPSEWKKAAEKGSGGKNAPLKAIPVPMAGDMPEDEDG